MRHILNQRELDRLIPGLRDNNTFVEVKRQNTAKDVDGLPVLTTTSIAFYSCDLQPILDAKSQITIEIGGEKAIPSFRAFFNEDVFLTAGDYLTPDGGTTRYEVLNVAKFDEHTEADLRVSRR